MEKVNCEADSCLDIIADGIYDGDRQTRDEAIIQCQTWALAFSEDGLIFARKNGFTGNRFQLTKWLEQNYPLTFKQDPLPSWKRQAKRLRSKQNPHSALASFQSFIDFTAPVREKLQQSATEIEAKIDRLVEQRRGG